MRISGLCVATSQSGAYYRIVSRLRKAGFPFESLLPDSDHGACQVVLTTLAEASKYGAKALVLEELDEDAGVFRGQVVSRLAGGTGVLVIGVDPGARMGLAAYYGETSIAFGTFASTTSLVSKVGAFVREVPAKKSIVRVGNGSPAHSSKIVESLRREAPTAVVEVVDESGTSTRTVRMRGVQGDQGAAAKIAFRKGEVVSQGAPRTPG